MPSCRGDDDCGTDTRARSSIEIQPAPSAPPQWHVGPRREEVAVTSETGIQKDAGGKEKEVAACSTQERDQQTTRVTCEGTRPHCSSALLRTTEDLSHANAAAEAAEAEAAA
jgi:hypothetical protein